MKKTYNIALTGILTGAAMALSFLESLLPAVAFLPPGAKLGLSNIVVMFAVSALPFPNVLFIIILKSVFAALFKGMTAFFISLSGGLLSFIILMVLNLRFKQKVGILGVSILSAAAHNTGQLIAACFIIGFAAFAGYFPLMILAGILAGAVTGIVFYTVDPYLYKLKKKLKK